MKKPTRGSRRGKTLSRQVELAELKDRYEVTYAEIAACSGYEESYLKLLGCGAKPVTERALLLIRMSLANKYPRSAPKEEKPEAAAAS